MALDILNDSGALDLLLPEVVAMQGVEQHPEHHAEGDVWEHTRLMLSNLNSEFFRNQFPFIWNNNCIAKGLVVLRNFEVCDNLLHEWTKIQFLEGVWLL